jgi:phosphatidate cytidylyltransferase
MIGGAMATAAVGWLFSTLPAVQSEVLLFDTVDWIGLALVVSVFATLGDLVESHLKRTADVKDSGSFIPGHGGVLDRFDGYLLAMPMAFSFVYLIYHL